MLLIIHACIHGAFSGTIAGQKETAKSSKFTFGNGSQGLGKECH